MKNKDNRPEQVTPPAHSGQTLRGRAEDIARKKATRSHKNPDALLPEEMRQVLHELQVHQIELELQNEELQRAHIELEAARARYFDLYDLAPVGYFTISEKGLILEANLAAATLLDVARGSLIQQPVSRFIMKEDQDIYYQFRKQLFENGEPQMCEVHMVGKNGSHFWVRLTATVANKADSMPVCRVVMIDITRLKQAEEELQKSERRLSFETLLADLSARLTNITVDQVDAEIYNVLRQINEFFQIDRCALLEILAEKGLCRITHAAYGEDVGQVSGEINLAELYPWSYEKLMRGEIVNISRLDDYPEEALMDRQTHVATGNKSVLDIPLHVSGQIPKIIVINSTTRNQVWPEEHIPRLRLLGEVLVNALERRENRRQLEEQLGFETLLSEISGHFVNLPADRVDGEIEDAQRRVCEFMGLDLSTLWQWSMETPRILKMTHIYRPPGGPPLPEPMYAHEFFPWALQQIESDKTVVVSSVDDLPAEAARDREVWHHFGTKSRLIFPLSSGGGTSIGALSFSTVLRERTWPETIIHRLLMVAQIFTSALIRKRAETSLRESEARLRLITETVGAALWSMDINTKKVWVSKKTRELFHFAPDEEVHYGSYFRLIHPEDKDRVDQEVQQALRSGEILKCDYRIILPDGTIRWITVRGQRVLKPTGEPDHLMGLSLDITERQRDRETIKKSEAKYRQLHESMMDGFVFVGMDGIFREFNDVYLKMTGYTRDELLQLTYRDLTPEKWHEFEQRIINEQVLVLGYSEIYEKEYRRKDGTVFPIELRTVLLKDETGANNGMWAIVRDITGRKRTETALRENEERLRLVLEANSEGVWDWNIPSGHAVFSTRYSAMLGYTPEEFSKSFNSWKELVHPDDFERVNKMHHDHFYNGKDFRVELRMRKKSGDWAWILSRGMCIERDIEGNPIRMVGTHLDITDHKKTEDEVRQYQKRLKALVSQLSIIEERERHSLAMDLHDYVGHSLALARMQLDGISKSSSPVEANMLVNDISKILLKSIQDCKDLMFELSSASIDEIGLADATAEWLEQYLGCRHSLEIEIINHSYRKHLDKDLEAIMFRNVRELSANIIRHANAKKVSVLFEDTAVGLEITVTDNGVGFDPEMLPVVSGTEKRFGLFSVRERMSDLGGSMQIISAPGRGCKVILTAPCVLITP